MQEMPSGAAEIAVPQGTDVSSGHGRSSKLRRSLRQIEGHTTR
jgi:hypothetical protein